MKSTYKQKLITALAQELFGSTDTYTSETMFYTLSKLTTQDLEFLYFVKTGRAGI